MSHDIVIVPTYDRPEYLALCLEKLCAAQDTGNKEIWVVQDNHADKPRDLDIIEQSLCVVSDAMRLMPRKIKHIVRKQHTSYGNSFNVLGAFREAYGTDARYVYLVEDDVLVMPDFFQWHEASQEQFHPFVSCAGRINRSLNFATNGPEAIDENCKDPLACVASGKAYGSWAACFWRGNLGLIAEEVFGNTMSFGPGHEQDILIQNMMTKSFTYHDYRVSRSFSVWPYVPRAYHMGWYSYHRTAGMKFNGTLEEKVAALRSAVSDPAKIRAMACLQEIDPYPTQPLPEWSGKLFLKSDYR